MGIKKSPIQYKRCIGDSFLFFILVPVIFVKSKHGGIYEGVQGSAFLLSWATSASCSIYESADATHLQQFILLRIGHVLIDSEEHFGSYTLLYAVENLERIGDRGFLDAYHIATLDDKGRLSVYASYHYTTILTGIGSNITDWDISSSLSVRIMPACAWASATIIRVAAR